MKKLFFVCLLLFGISLPVFAAPPFLKGMPEPKELPGPTLQERFGMMPSGLMRAPTSYPTPTVNILFLKVDFPPLSDPLTTGSGAWNDPLYAHSSNPDYWVNLAETKFVDYWNEVSYGLLPIQITVSSKVYRLPNPMGFYGDESDRSLQNLIYDSITTASTDTVQPITNFSPYDAVLIVHAGVGQESDIAQASPNDIWSLYYRSGSICKDLTNNCLSTPIKDGAGTKIINEAIIMPQTDSRVYSNPSRQVTLDPLGVYVHEFGHWLGLPDLYCTAPSTCTIDPVGSWSLMAYGSYNPIGSNSIPAGSLPAHLDAWSLAKLGWVIPQQVSSESFLALGPVETVPPPPPAAAAAGTGVLQATATTGPANEYFLIENRRQTGFDAGLPGQGLLVWEIDADQIASTIGANAINNSLARLGIQLVEADGDRALIAGNDVGSTGDPFPGSTNNTLLSPVTNPSSIPYTNYGWVNIRNILEDTTAGDVSFNIGFAPLPPQNPAIDAATKTISWTQSSGAASYNVYKNGFGVPVSVPANGAPSYLDSANQSTDYYVITAVDANNNESQASVRVPAQSTGTVITSSGGGTACFIATAAYGSYLDPHVKILRTFRDRYLLTNGPGRALVAFYYRNSPPLAAYISRHEGLRTAARWALTPVVFAAEYFRVLMLIVPVLCLAVVIGVVRKRSRRV